eukprot:GSA25T00000054001.1
MTSKKKKKWEKKDPAHPTPPRSASPPDPVVLQPGYLQASSRGHVAHHQQHRVPVLRPFLPSMSCISTTCNKHITLLNSNWCPLEQRLCLLPQCCQKVDPLQRWALIVMVVQCVCLY